MEDGAGREPEATNKILRRYIEATGCKSVIDSEQARMMAARGVNMDLVIVADEPQRSRHAGWWPN